MQLNRLILSLILCLSVHSFSVNINLLCRDYFNRSSEKELRKYFKDRGLGLYGEKPSTDLLLFLMNIMEMYQVPGPIDFIFLKEEGPEKIFRYKDQKSKIMITKNANEGLLLTQVNDIAQEVCLKKSKQRDFNIEYNQTIFEQFLRALVPKDQVLKELINHTGLSFRSKKSDEGFDEEQDFRREELITLYKTFIDIPPHVFKKLDLKTMARMRIGKVLYVNKKAAKADYNPRLKKIRLTDAATMDSDDIYGEGTIIHELGHAFSNKFNKELKEEFFQISWKYENGKWKLKKNYSIGFISDYAMTKPEEDFAEHFSAYVHEPELLKSEAQEKYEYMQKNVFVDTEYFSMVANNARVYIDSKITDKVKPEFLSNLNKSFTYEMIQKEGKKTIINFVITQAYDELSGISHALGTFEHESKKQYKMSLKLKPIDDTQKETSIIGQIIFDPEKYASGVYELDSLFLKDKSGNRTIYRGNPLLQIKLEGNLGTQDFKDTLNTKKIKIKELEKIDDYPVYEIKLPIKHFENLKSVNLDWELEGIEEKTRHHNFKFLSSPGDSETIIKVAFHKQYSNQKVNLSNVRLSLEGTKKYAPTKLEYVVKKSDNKYINLDTGVRKHKVNEPDLNLLTIKAIKEKNEHDGIHNIQIRIPLRGEKYGSTQMSVVFRDPKGKRIHHSYGEDWRGSGEAIEKDGKFIYKFKIPLKKYPEKGYYILESVKTQTKFERPRLPRDISIDTGGGFIHRKKVIERGIRRKFKITEENELMF